MAYRNLQPGERSPSVTLLNYISQFGTSEGAYQVLGNSETWVEDPYARLLVRGYIRGLGDGIEVTKKGWDYLAGENLPEYERIPIENRKELEGELSSWYERDYRERNAALLEDLQKLGVDTKNLTIQDLWRVYSLLKGMGGYSFRSLDEFIRAKLHQTRRLEIASTLALGFNVREKL